MNHFLNIILVLLWSLSGTTVAYSKVKTSPKLYIAKQPFRGCETLRCGKDYKVHPAKTSFRVLKSKNRKILIEISKSPGVKSDSKSGATYWWVRSDNLKSALRNTVSKTVSSTVPSSVPNAVRASVINGLKAVIVKGKTSNIKDSSGVQKLSKTNEIKYQMISKESQRKVEKLDNFLTKISLTSNSVDVDFSEKARLVNEVKEKAARFLVPIYVVSGQEKSKKDWFLAQNTLLKFVLLLPYSFILISFLSILFRGNSILGASRKHSLEEVVDPYGNVISIKTRKRINTFGGAVGRPLHVSNAPLNLLNIDGKSSLSSPDLLNGIAGSSKPSKKPIGGGKVLEFRSRSVGGPKASAKASKISFNSKLNKSNLIKPCLKLINNDQKVTEDEITREISAVAPTHLYKGSDARSFEILESSDIEIEDYMNSSNSMDLNVDEMKFASDISPDEIPSLASLPGEDSTSEIKLYELNKSEDVAIKNHEQPSKTEPNSEQELKEDEVSFNAQEYKFIGEGTMSIESISDVSYKTQDQTDSQLRKSS